MKILVAFVLGFLVAQVAKTIGALVSGKAKAKDIPEYLVKSGGMPSGHSASFVAAATEIGLLTGFESAVFALAICTTVIIIYDAMNVRYAVGEQGKMLNELIEHHGHKRHGERKLKVVEGHTLPQVIVGALLGIGIGLLVNTVL